jgi:hypothetical protein
VNHYKRALYVRQADVEVLPVKQIIGPLDDAGLAEGKEG